MSKIGRQYLGWIGSTEDRAKLDETKETAAIIEEGQRLLDEHLHIAEQGDICNTQT